MSDDESIYWPINEQNTNVDNNRVAECQSQEVAKQSNDTSGHRSSMSMGAVDLQGMTSY